MSHHLTDTVKKYAHLFIIAIACLTLIVAGFRLSTTFVTSLLSAIVSSAIILVFGACIIVACRAVKSNLSNNH